MEQTPTFTANETSSDMDMMEVDVLPGAPPVERAATATQDDIQSEAEGVPPAEASGDVEAEPGVPSSGLELILYRTAQLRKWLSTRAPTEGWGDPDAPAGALVPQTPTKGMGTLSLFSTPSTASNVSMLSLNMSVEDLTQFALEQRAQNRRYDITNNARLGLLELKLLDMTTRWDCLATEFEGFLDVVESVVVELASA
ncbi:hypothetical protein C8Q76DRAFT_789930 [Earliella scabrosa]|nr:hypothetical protein C8Q76DRAFT_789930 [Earliella scabrosa]